MKNNIDFYQHYASADQHPKFKMLRVVFGWSGEGKFWALNNRIAQSENCCLDISKKYNRAAVASDLDFKLAEFDKFIACLMEDCELIIECEPGVITTDMVQEVLEKVSKDRASARERSRRRWQNTAVSSPEKKKSSPEKVSKGKERKVKESKTIKKKIKKKSFSAPTQIDVESYFVENGFLKEAGVKAFNYYHVADWKDSRGNQVKNWKQKMRGVWFKDENKVGQVVNNIMSRSERNAKECFDFINEGGV